ncbi:tetratricopeptide repeat protein [Flaviaesturariibacter amylovorans]|uniref:RNA polymerase sigma factor 70 region 4 type 2 domain-containing protein n=1 Tax=Flaviaesturariibacter amylovorans TaxID=1084520 RepID=A0ABP8GWC2_9BACT
MPAPKRTLLLLFLSLATILSAPLRMAAQTSLRDYTQVLQGLPLAILPADTADRFIKAELRARAAGDAAAQQLIELCRLHYLVNRTPQVGQAEQRLLRLLPALQRSGSEAAGAHALFLLSEACWRRGDQARALEYALKAYGRYTVWSGTEFPLKYHALTQLSLRFYHYLDFATARRIAGEALATKGAVELPEPHIVLNTIGLCLRATGQTDSAVAYFQKALAEAGAASRPVWVGIVKGNLGIAYYAQGSYAEAIPLIAEDIHESEATNNTFRNRVKSLAILGECYARLGRRAESAATLEKAQALFRERRFEQEHDLVTELFPRLARHYAGQGDFERATGLLEAAARSRDTLVRRQSALVLAGAQLRVFSEKYAAETAYFGQQRRNQLLMRNMLIGGIVLLAGMALLVIRHQRVRHLLREQQAASGKERAEAELQSATARLGQITQAMHEKNRLIEQLQHEWEERAAEEEAFGPEAQQTVSRLRDLTILTEEAWEEFQALFEKVHTGFLFRLRQKLPDLNPAEVRFMTLAKLHFSNKEIAAVLGISAGAVRTTRSRLRKKLGLAEEGDLEGLIARI